MRALELCLNCVNALEIKSNDLVLTPAKCCWQKDVECSRLKRHWPGCKAGENVFSEESACASFLSGVPCEVFVPLTIIASPGYK